MAHGTEREGSAQPVPLCHDMIFIYFSVRAAVEATENVWAICFVGFRIQHISDESGLHQQTGGGSSRGGPLALRPGSIADNIRGDKFSFRAATLYAGENI